MLTGQIFPYSSNYKVQLIKVVEEKMTSLIIGIVVSTVLIFSIFTLSQKYLFSQNNHAFSQALNKEKGGTNTYKVQEGDTLWEIAEKKYGSGFNAYDIMQANQMTDADCLVKGQNIILPKVTPKKSTQGEVSTIQTTGITIKGNTYKVKEGDFLTQIAIDAYGDANMVYKLIQANDLSNPEILESGIILKIPRK